MPRKLIKRLTERRKSKKTSLKTNHRTRRRVPKPKLKPSKPSRVGGSSKTVHKVILESRPLLYSTPRRPKPHPDHRAEFMQKMEAAGIHAGITGKKMKVRLNSEEIAQNRELIQSIVRYCEQYSYHENN